jgi:hypothetical protein
MSPYILTLLSLMGETPHLELTANRIEIQTCDFVIVKSVISNKSESAVYVEHKVAGPAIQFEIKNGETWIPIRGMYDRKAHGVLRPPLLDIDARYAEFNLILLDGKDQFVFSQPGRFELRAEVQLSGKQVQSKPVVITVKPRAQSLVKRIQDAGISVGTAGGAYLKPPLPDKLVALEDVGGNIGDSIKNKLLMQRIVSGEERTGDDVIKYIRERMDPLDAEISLAILGEHYFRKKQDWANLAKVAAEFKEDSWLTFSWQASLDFHALQQLPMLVVPPEPARKP